MIPANIQHQLAAIHAGIDAEDFRNEIMALAAKKSLSVESVALAIADVLGIAAARLDQEEGGFSLQDRLHSFCERVEETYERARSK